ncbi:uncharacterized protein LOC119667271 [Teleopsis dalmanni]|uniref:uncharacterized protein LOC119667271 n=1 Tax=Teleopsis dalmanni TaxID=139649 RepID=UPI0018CD6082|nr:uncharacterized protein LOC119667271 [Teleopsis dalmanni]
MLNSRPITPLSSDPNNPAALTSGHFLIGEPLTALPSRSETTTKQSLLTRWKQVNHLKNEFWSRWSKEYLNELQCRTKWKDQSPDVKEGMLVIIQEDNAPPLQWPLGRIIKCYSGNDGRIRVVDVKTKNGIWKRPIHRLATLLPEDCSTPMMQLDRCDEEKPKKRAKLNINLLAIALLVLLWIPLISGLGITIKSFNNTPGIHFEHKGVIKRSQAEWKIIAYYDLSPLQQEFEFIENGTESLANVCKLMNGVACISIHYHLINEVTTMREHLRSTMQLPVNMSNISELYSLMTVSSGLVDTKMLFQISLPLINDQSFDLFVVIPVPGIINGEYVTITPCTSMMAFNTHRNGYFPISEIQLSQCVSSKNDVFICSDTQEIYSLESGKCTCEVNLFNNSTSSCNW